MTQIELWRAVGEPEVTVRSRDDAEEDRARPPGREFRDGACCRDPGDRVVVALGEPEVAVGTRRRCRTDSRRAVIPVVKCVTEPPAGNVAVSIRPMDAGQSAPDSANHIAPSGPATIPTGRLVSGRTNSVIVPACVIRPTLDEPAEPSPFTVYQRFPSGPAAMSSTWMSVPREYWLIVDWAARGPAAIPEARSRRPARRAMGRRLIGPSSEDGDVGRVYTAVEQESRLRARYVEAAYYEFRHCFGRGFRRGSVLGPPEHKSSRRTRVRPTRSVPVHPVDRGRSGPFRRGRSGRSRRRPR